ncbi:hypothetical protein NZK33_16160 [Cyanobium sp. FGCU-6]|nr:hypothetical protein [Cyanobium sp. FGCU6]
MGINLLNGAIAGKGVNPGEPSGPTGAPGQNVTYNITQIRSLEDLYESVGVSARASGQYNLFSASGKFKYVNESRFTSQSIFLLARCVVENAFKLCENVNLLPEAATLISSGKQDIFQQRYGDGFVRGMQMGGEFFAIISISSSTEEMQQKIAASLQAKYGGALASASADMRLNNTTKEMISQSQVNISTYQRAGTGEEQRLADDIEEVMQRLCAFPSIVLNQPVPYEVLVSDYRTLNLPVGPNLVDITTQGSRLSDYERLHLKLLTIRNDIEFVQSHTRYFNDPPTITQLNQWQQEVAQEIDTLISQASQCCNNPSECPVFPMRLPSGYYMPERKETRYTDEPLLNLFISQIIQALEAHDLPLLTSLFDEECFTEMKHWMTVEGYSSDEQQSYILEVGLKAPTSMYPEDGLKSNHFTQIQHISFCGKQTPGTFEELLFFATLSDDTRKRFYCQVKSAASGRIGLVGGVG